MKAPGRAVVGTAGVLVLLAAVFLGLRYWLATTATLGEAYYDEALTGLMGLAILRGIPQVFYWGEPYGGAAGDAYIAAAGFGLFGPSTLVLRMSAATVAVLWVWAAFDLARRIAGAGAGVLAGLLVAVPPVFVSFVQLSSQGEGVAMALATVALMAAARLVDPDAGPRGEGPAWALLGLAGGLGWWDSPMTGMCLLAAGLGIVGLRPRALRERGPWVALGLFVLASLPFWIWNRDHDWVTFRHFAGWGPPLPDVATRVAVVGDTLLATLRGAFWDSRAVSLPPGADLLGWLLVAAVYAPADYTAFVHIEGPGRRLIHDHALGKEFGTSWWAEGELTEETLPLVVPADAPPGTYRVKVGLWLPEQRRRAQVAESDLPHDRSAVVVGPLTVVD